DLARDLPIGPGSLTLDDIQRDMMMDAVAAPSLASQLRALTPDFGRSLTHADQTAFAAECLREARKLVMDEDAELLSWSLERWKKRTEISKLLKEGAEI